MKIDTSLLNQGPNLAWGNERQITHENLTKKSDNMDTIDSTRLEAVTRDSNVGLSRYPSMKMALRNLTSSRIFQDASAHIQFASSINQQRVMAERVHHLTTI